MPGAQSFTEKLIVAQLLYKFQILYLILMLLNMAYGSVIILINCTIKYP